MKVILKVNLLPDWIDWIKLRGSQHGSSTKQYSFPLAKTTDLNKLKYPLMLKLTEI